MDAKEFKSTFGKVAKNYLFEKAFTGWFKESHECIAVLDLQKSNYGNYFELNIKIFVQGLFGNNYSKNKDLVKKETGNIFLRQPNKFRNIFDLDTSMEIDQLIEKLSELFNEFIMPFTEKALTIKGIKELYKNGELFLLPAVKQQLEI
ncbi:DUF4304 domain-containing protein [Mucilaginibacter sp. NFX135]|uniref:DUF4304 domain-containing protein n=1 Tax=Mucilaginibacter sp. NFX135 TaxID=3402687 RepID=UPI003AFA0235